MEFAIFDLGLVEYTRAFEQQKKIFDLVKGGEYPGALIACRHKPVITIGRAAMRTNILAPQERLKEMGIEVCEVDRGGDVTYHGPGQLTIYPVFDLALLKKDIRYFLRILEDVVISFLEDFSLCGERINGLTGVWSGRSKICSIGIAVKNWITFHGLSINVKRNDLSNFSLIRPCGMDIQMTSVESMSGEEIDIAAAKSRLIDKFKSYFNNLPTS